MKKKTKIKGLGMYILEKGKPKSETDILKWGRWMETYNRIMERNMIGNVMISTVFLGIDHSFGEDKPVLYETMIFGSKLKPIKDFQVRYCTLKEAQKGHAYAVKLAKQTLNYRK